MEFNPKEIKLIIGLGNPDSKYANTYHNVGFLLINYLTKNNSPYPIPYTILASNVYMNMSGNFVAKKLKEPGLKPDGLLIVHDDSDIELGKYKLTFGRGAAGHHGVESVIKALGTKNFWRLRIGIRPKASFIRRSPNEALLQSLVRRRIKAGEFVLKKISSTDKKLLEKTFESISKVLNPKFPKRASPSGYSQILNSKNGFTLIELLIYIAIFAIILTAFMAVFLQVLRIQGRQAATTEVMNQSQFLMQRIQQLVRESDGINMTAGVSTSTLTLTFASSSLNPTVVRLNNNIIKLKQGSGTELDLSSSKVSIDKLDFIKYNLPPLGGNPNKGLVSIEIKISYADGINNPQLQFSQIVRSAAAPLLYK